MKRRTESGSEARRPGRAQRRAGTQNPRRKRQSADYGSPLSRGRPLGFGPLLATLIAFVAVVAGARARAEEPYQADPKLVQAAQKEGEVVLYTTLIVDQAVRPMVKAFRAHVAGVDVKIVRADSAQLVVRLITEGRAGRVQADVWHVADEFAPIKQNNLAMPFEVPSARGLPAELADPNGYWVATNLSTRSLAYNTQLIPAGQVPHTHKDLLDPRWKGQMVWHPDSIAGGYGFIGVALKSMGEENGMRYLRALAKQNVVPLAVAARAVLDRVIAGEYAIGLDMNSSHAAISAALGAPVRWVPLDPVTMTTQIAGISRGAPHPNAAKLFLDFMVSRAGQEVFRDVDYVPMRPDVPAKSPELKPETGGYKALMLTPDEIDADGPHWAKVYEDLFR